MLQVDLTPELERQLANIAARAGAAPDELARRALLAYLEDLEDYAVAVEAWKTHDSATTVDLDDVMARLGVADDVED